MQLGIREMLFFAVLLAVPIAAYVYVFQPRNSEITEARDEIMLKQARLDQVAQVVSRIDDIGEAIQAGQESIKLIEAKLPRAQDVEGVLEQVSQIAEQNNLVIRSINPDSPVPAAMYMELPLRLAMDGHFDGFYQFLLEVENLPRITRIHNLEMKRGDDRRGSSRGPELPPGSMRAEFTLSIYFEPQNARASAS
jgi:type IV pilus assembly protein PilO